MALTAGLLCKAWFCIFMLGCEHPALPLLSEFRDVV